MFSLLLVRLALLLRLARPELHDDGPLLRRVDFGEEVEELLVVRGRDPPREESERPLDAERASFADEDERELPEARVELRVRRQARRGVGAEVDRDRIARQLLEAAYDEVELARRAAAP